MYLSIIIQHPRRNMTYVRVNIFCYLRQRLRESGMELAVH